jgi:PAS domain S-box-containing protein
MRSVRVKKKIGQAEANALAFFISVVVILVVFSTQITTVVLFGLGADLHETEAFMRMQALVVITLIIIIGMGTELVLTRHQLTHRTQHLAEEMVSDLRFSREQFRMLYENSPVPYFLMNDNGIIRNPNRASLRFFEGTEEDCNTLDFFSLVNIPSIEGEESEASDTLSLWRTKIERGLPITRQEMTVRTISGSQKWVMVSIYSLNKSTQVPFKHLVTLVDITKEKESETVKTDFLLLASHQLRTPLTTIKWYIDYLLTSKSVEVSDEVREYLEQIYTGNERMIDLITTLLTVSRIEMGTLAPEYTRMHLGELVDDVLKELEPDIEKKHMKVEKQIDEDDVLTTDKTMMRIAIHNLCTNAIKYSPSEGTVFIEGSFVSGMCSLTVRDTGYGIPPSEQEKIFTKMFRASNARQVSANGTGLGLHLTKAFIEKLGGTIDFTSELNKGTSFLIKLPRVAPDA